MRVLQVVPVDKNGNPPIFVQKQIESLARQGVASSIYRISGSSLSLLALFRSVSGLSERISTDDPDLVHAHWGSILSCIVMFACAIKRKRFVITYRGSDVNPTPSDGYFGSRLRILLSIFASIFAKANVCVSPELSERLGRKSGNVVLPDGTDLSAFSGLSYLSCREQLGWDPDESVIFFYKGSSPQVKRYDLAMETLQALNDRENVGLVRLEVVGTGLSQQEVAQRICASDCLLMLSDFEGSPNIVREALVCKTPVVSFPVGDVLRWLSHQDSSKGVVVERDLKQVISATEKILQRKSRGDGVLPNVQFSQEEVAKELFRVYQNCLLT